MSVMPAKNYSSEGQSSQSHLKKLCTAFRSPIAGDVACRRLYCSFAHTNFATVARIQPVKCIIKILLLAAAEPFCAKAEFDKHVKGKISVSGFGLREIEPGNVDARAELTDIVAAQRCR